MDTWDSGRFWDSGLQWDINNEGVDGDISPYLARVTSEHSDKPDFIAVLSLIVKPFADEQLMMAQMPSAFDIDNAAGTQLDILGLWIGRTRYLPVPITGVYFTFDTGPGFDRGIFRGPFDPVSDLVRLPDDYYRLYLRAVIASNQWDGTIPGAYAAYQIMFSETGFSVQIRDNQNMSMDMLLAGPIPDALTKALFLGGYLSLRPAGVRIRKYVISANSDKPIFRFDVKEPSIGAGGFDVGAFANIIDGN